MLKINGLNYTYPKTSKAVLTGIELEIKPKEIMVFLGENGSGKTTTLKLITGLIEQKNDDIFFGNISLLKNPDLYKQKIAYIPDYNLLPEKLKVSEYLNFMSSLWNVKSTKQEVEAILDKMNLLEKKNQFCDTLSKGMQQKLMLAGALIHDPDLIIMDEPFTGLDIAGIAYIKKTLRELVDNGKSVLLTTHIIPFAEEIGDQFCFIKNGYLSFTGNKQEFINVKPHLTGLTAEVTSLPVISTEI